MDGDADVGRIHRRIRLSILRSALTATRVRSLGSGSVKENDDAARDCL